MPSSGNTVEVLVAEPVLQSVSYRKNLSKASGRPALPIQFSGSGSDTTALNDPYQNHDDRDNQKDMDESSHGVRRDKTKKPEDNEDYCKCSDHVGSPFKIELYAG
jgi:hypothetical protein